MEITVCEPWMVWTVGNDYQLHPAARASIMHGETRIVHVSKIPLVIVQAHRTNLFCAAGCSSGYEVFTVLLVV